MPANVEVTGVPELSARPVDTGYAYLMKGRKMHWRDVVDELPQEAQEVLFVRGGKTVHGAWIGGIFWHSNQQMAAAQWMPLPEPPKVGAGDTAKYDEKEPLHGKDAYQLSEA